MYVGLPMYDNDMWSMACILWQHIIISYTAGLDYQNQATPSEITFASGSNVDNTMSVMIPINDDVLNEADETIIISLIANNPELDDGLSELIYIIDNDRKLLLCQSCLKHYNRHAVAMM